MVSSLYQRHQSVRAQVALSFECGLLVRTLMCLPILTPRTYYVILNLKLWKALHHRLLHHHLQFAIAFVAKSCVP